jgi:hypothetical protein
LSYRREVHSIRAPGVAAVLSIVSIVSVATPGLGGSLSGAWFFGTDAPEPKEAVLSVPERCWHGGVDFTLTETGKKLTGEVRWIEATGGVARPPRWETERLRGTRSGNHVVLTGEHKVVTGALIYPATRQDPPPTTVKYDLRFDRRTGHLVGTRDGQPLWLARFKTYQVTCGGPPP